MGEKGLQICLRHSKLSRLLRVVQCRGASPHIEAGSVAAAPVPIATKAMKAFKRFMPPGLCVLRDTNERQWSYRPRSTRTSSHFIPSCYGLGPLFGCELSGATGRLTASRDQSSCSSPTKKTLPGTRPVSQCLADGLPRRPPTIHSERTVLEFAYTHHSSLIEHPDICLPICHQDKDDRRRRGAP